MLGVGAVALEHGIAETDQWSRRLARPSDIAQYLQARHGRQNGDGLAVAEPSRAAKGVVALQRRVGWLHNEYAEWQSAHQARGHHQQVFFLDQILELSEQSLVEGVRPCQVKGWHLVSCQAVGPHFGAPF